LSEKRQFSIPGLKVYADGYGKTLVAIQLEIAGTWDRLPTDYTEKVVTYYHNSFRPKPRNGLQTCGITAMNSD
jgi:hypothetical protein